MATLLLIAAAALLFLAAIYRWQDRLLYFPDALGGHKRLMVIRDSGHNDWPDHVDAPWVASGYRGGTGRASALKRPRRVLERHFMHVARADGQRGQHHAVSHHASGRFIVPGSMVCTWKTRPA